MSLERAGRPSQRRRRGGTGGTGSTGSTGSTALVQSGSQRLEPAARALLDLYLANRVEGEDYVRCFSRLGAPGYAALLRRAFE